jgi:hypothetical protein
MRVPSGKEYTRILPVASRTTLRLLLVLVYRMISTPLKSCTCGRPSGNLAGVRIHSRSATMSPFTSKEQTCPAGMTNGGVLVGSHPPLSWSGLADAGTAVTITSPTVRAIAVFHRMASSAAL